MLTNTTTPTPERLLLPPREAAGVLSISERSLWTLTKSGEIPSVRIGRSVRYSVAALEAWIASKSTFMAEQGQQAEQAVGVHQTALLDVPKSTL